MGRVTDWIAAAARRRDRAAAPVDYIIPPPSGPPPDHERVERVGEVLHSCYGEGDEVLDDKLTALMLRLTVEQTPPTIPRKR